MLKVDKVIPLQFRVLKVFKVLLVRVLKDQLDPHKVLKVLKVVQIKVYKVQLDLHKVLKVCKVLVVFRVDLDLLVQLMNGILISTPILLVVVK